MRVRASMGFAGPLAGAGKVIPCRLPVCGCGLLPGHVGVFWKANNFSSIYIDKETILKLLRNFRKKIRKLAFRLSGGTHFKQKHYFAPWLAQARPNAMSDHLNTLFWHVMEASPDYIVELGTRGGDSTRVLLEAADKLDIKVLSIDINDCGEIDVPHRERWEFVQSDDVGFGEQGFPRWCEGNGLSQQAKFIYIDTSHLYEHTCKEIAVWSKHLADGGVMVFHDTNMRKVYGRLDGSAGFGWDNQRGVIRALEEFLGRSYDQNTFFTDIAGGYLVRHYPNCSGMTVLKKMGSK